MRNSYLLSAVILMLVLSGCDEGDKDKNVSEIAKPVVSNAEVISDLPELKVLAWGPFSTTVGTVFNKQPNGQSAFWFKMAGSIKFGEKLELWLGDNKVSDIVLNSENAGSSLLSTSLLDKEGDYPLYLIHAPSKKRFDIGIFKIKPAPVGAPSTEVVSPSVEKSTPSIDTSSTATIKKSAKRKVTQTQ